MNKAEKEEINTIKQTVKNLDRKLSSKVNTPNGTFKRVGVQTVKKTAKASGEPVNALLAAYVDPETMGRGAKVPDSYGAVSATVQSIINTTVETTAGSRFAIGLAPDMRDNLLKFVNCDNAAALSAPVDWALFDFHPQDLGLMRDGNAVSVGGNYQAMCLDPYCRTADANSQWREIPVSVMLPNEMVGEAGRNDFVPNCRLIPKPFAVGNQQCYGVRVEANDYIEIMFQVVGSASAATLTAEAHFFWKKDSLPNVVTDANVTVPNIPLTTGHVGNMQGYLFPEGGWMILTFMSTSSANTNTNGVKLRLTTSDNQNLEYLSLQGHLKSGRHALNSVVVPTTVPDFSTYQNEIFAYRMVSASLLCTNVTPALDRGGDITGNLIVSTNEPAFLQNGLFTSVLDYDQLAQVPGSYVGLAEKGAFGVWKPQSAKDFEWKDFCLPWSYNMPYLWISGNAPAGKAQTFRAHIVCNWEVRTLSQKYSLSQYIYDPIVMAHAISALASFPSVQENALHLSSIVDFLKRAAKTVYNNRAQIGGTVAQIANSLGQTGVANAAAGLSRISF